VNLSWSAQLPEDNRIVEGVWWEKVSTQEGITPVSIERDLADELGLALGDQLTFSLGGLAFNAVITSTRYLEWDNMTPNFYFLFPQGALEEFPRIYITSLYIPPDRKLVLNELLGQYPTIQAVELDTIISRIKSIVSQVTRGLEMMTLMILGCGVLVLFAAVSLSMNERMEECAILRTLGSSRKLILGVQLVEFFTLGLVAGILAVLGAETALVLLQTQMFGLPARVHPWIWFAGPVGGASLVSLLGLFYSRKAVVQPPLRLLNSTRF
jgi:putative ABC transport system permease protein